MQARKWLLLGGLLLLATPVLAGAGAIELENRDPFCAACHTEPETTFVARSVDEPVDLASVHAAAPQTVRCIDCHSGQGFGGRLGSLQQGALDLAVFLQGGYDQPSVTENPVGDGGCVKCHFPAKTTNPPAEEAETLNRSHYHLEAYLDAWRHRRRNPAGTCAVCHAAHWQGGLAATGFRNNIWIQAACEDCHSSLAGWAPPEG